MKKVTQALVFTAFSTVASQSMASIPNKMTPESYNTSSPQVASEKAHENKGNDAEVKVAACWHYGCR